MAKAKAMTLFEKVICSHSRKKRVESGEAVAVRADRVICYDTFLAALTDAFPQKHQPPADDPDRIVVCCDQFSAAARGTEQLIRRLRELAGIWRLKHFYDLGRGGIPAVIVPDAGLVRPGDLAAGPDGQILTLGAMGLVSLQLETSALIELISTGWTEINVPPTLRIVLQGELQRWVGGSDLAFHLRSKIPRETMKGCVLELVGEVVAGLNLHDRFALVAGLDRLDVHAVVVEPDEKTRVFCRARCATKFPLLHSDKEASFLDVIEIDCRRIEPQVWIEEPEEQAEKEPEEELREKPEDSTLRGRSLNLNLARRRLVQQVVVGGCSHGRVEDIRALAHFLRDYMIHPDVRLTLIPGSQQILLHAMEEGLIQIIIRAGGHIGIPSCRYDHDTRVAAMNNGEMCLATSLIPVIDEIRSDTPTERKGEADNGTITFCNPSIAAVAAIMGELHTPLDLARNVRRMATGTNW